MDKRQVLKNIIKKMKPYTSKFGGKKKLSERCGLNYNRFVIDLQSMALGTADPHLSTLLKFAKGCETDLVSLISEKGDNAIKSLESASVSDLAKELDRRLDVHLASKMVEKAVGDKALNDLLLVLGDKMLQDNETAKKIIELLKRNQKTA